MGATGALSMQAGTSIAGAYVQSRAQKAQAAYQESIYNINASYSELQAKDAEERGTMMAGEIRRQTNRSLSIVRQKGKQVRGSQKAAIAAQGIEVNSGSAADALAETDSMAEQDAIEIRKISALNILTVKNNAWAEAWGYRTQAMSYQFKGRMTKLAGETESRNTLLTGITRATGYGLEAYGKYQERHPKAA